MFGLGHTELIVTLGICSFLVRAGKLPEFGRSLGAGMRSFNNGIDNDAAAAHVLANPLRRSDTRRHKEAPGRPTTL